MLDRILWLVLMAGALLLGGCTADPADLKRSNHLKVETFSTGGVLLEEPVVWQENGSTVVHGHIRRAPDAFKVHDGHTHVQVRLPDGAAQEQLVPWFPRWIPFQSPRYSTYQATYPGTVSPNSVVRVWVCFDEHAPATRPTP